MTVLITLTTAGADSGPFDLYSDLDGYLSAFESGVSKASLEAGYASSLVPDYTNIIRVKSNGVFCTNSVNIPVGITTTTTTSSTTTTTTTVNPVVSCTCYTITNVGYVDGPGEEPALQGTNVTYRDCNGDPAMEVLPLVGNSVTICAETDSVVTLGDPATVEVSVTNCCTAPTADAILWDFEYTDGPGILGHQLAISAPGNTPTYASVTSNGAIVTWSGTNINIQVTAVGGEFGGQAYEVYSSLIVTMQSREVPYNTLPVNSIGGNCALGNNTLNLIIPDYDPTYQYTISAIVADCSSIWDPNTAQRSQVFVGQNSFSNPTSCCSDVTQTLYLATRNQNVMSVGDVLFTTLSGTTRFNGGGDPSNNYFKFNGMSLLNSAECFPLDCPTCSEVITVDSLGVITGKTCCS
jgi:hypothetical protein